MLVHQLGEGLVTSGTQAAEELSFLHAETIRPVQYQIHPGGWMHKCEPAFHGSRIAGLG